MAEVFSSNSETVLQRSVDVNLSESGIQPEDLQELYQINETCSFITSNNFQKVKSDLAGKLFTVFWVLLTSNILDADYLKNADEYQHLSCKSSQSLIEHR